MQYKSVMNPDTVIQGDHWRIGVITDSLLRLEWSDSATFEDLPTQTIVNRDFGMTPQFTVKRTLDGITVETSSLRLSYDGQRFSQEGLSVYVKGMPDVKTNTWHYSDSPDGNLRGTARTLDWANGEIPLDTGVLSRDGWAVLDDSAGFTLGNGPTTGDGIPLPTPREHEEIDIYLFCHGHRYTDAMRDFYQLTGQVPLLPRYALGNWWSRFHRYTDDEYLSLVNRFADEHIPFTVAVLDMDWHIVDPDPKYGSGWTGYTWNTDLFPDPQRFLASLHDHGYRVTLNVHPRDGIRAFEDAYPAMASAMGIDPASQTPIEFDPTDPHFLDAYLTMHRELERQGVDFWWIDWQQGSLTRQPGLDPLWSLNHIHYLDSQHDGRWPIAFSRYAGPGSHRYPIGFSGDTIVTWQSLAFQPYFTATASNIGYCWWSHDIGGHMFGYRDEDLEARWYQLGTFSPINRLHSTVSTFSSKEPWNYHGQARTAATQALRLRHALLPYLYTMNWRTHLYGEPLVQPMYWRYSESDTAYAVPDQFSFGTELIVSPIVEPNDGECQRGRATVWMPQGLWFDFFDGRHYRASGKLGRTIEVWRTLERMPVFAKAGAIIPMQSWANNSIDNPAAMHVLVFPGADNSFTMYEDNGIYADVQDGINSSGLCRTQFTWTSSESTPSFTISPASGNTSSVPESRQWTLTFRGIRETTVHAEHVSADGTKVPIPAEISYDRDTLSLIVQIPAIDTGHTVIVSFPEGANPADNPLIEDAHRVLHDARMPYLTKEQAFSAITESGVNAIAQFGTMEHTSSSDPQDCSDSHMPASVRRALAEVLLRD